MELEHHLLEMDETMGRISDGLNAIRLMILGLEEAQDPFAGGLHMVWSYLEREEQAMRENLEACFKVV